MVAAFGATPAEAIARLARPAAVGFDVLASERIAYDREAVALAEAPATTLAGVEALYGRSLLVLEQLTDRHTGATIAAPEFDPDFVHSGGYGFVWPRDLAYNVLSLLSAGRGDLARPALRWLAREQAPEGLWLQRYWTDGSLAPSWGLHQLDETGVVVFAYEAAWRALGDAALDRELWPSARAAGDFLCDFLDPELRASAAERRSLGADGRAALVQRGGDVRGPRRVRGDGGAARAGARGALPRCGRARACRDRRAPLERGARPISPLPLGRALRRARRRAARDLRAPAAVSDEGSSQRRPRGLARRQLAPRPQLAVRRRRSRRHPGCAPRSPRSSASSSSTCGGVLRHEGDDYAGGNAWLISTLWLGLAQRQAGDEAGWTRAIEYALARQTPLGLLPEQVTDAGDPAWVVPLGWSHAMLVLAARPELAVVRDATA